MPDCRKCSEPMTYSEIESTMLREVYRCFGCGTRKSKRSPLSWTLLGGRLLLLFSIGLPPDASDLIDPELIDASDLVDPELIE